MNAGHVLDSFAIIAWLKNAEPSASTINQILLAEGYIAMSAINIGEVVYILRKHFTETHADAFLKRLPNLPVEIITPTFADILDAAHLKFSYPISYADAFAAQLAMKKGVPLVTGDAEFRVIPHLACLWLQPDNT